SIAAVVLHQSKKTKAMEKHDLHHEFPELNQKIHDMKTHDHHFRKLFDEYHDINNSIHSMESGAQHVKDEVLNEYRMKRVHLKDELYQMLTSN
ncbi:MAG: YdcH family protein, partial [Bacteroidota bacterium]